MTVVDSGAFAVVNAVGLVAFAVVGCLKAADADLDLFGVVVLGVLTALGGGMLRDVLVGRVPAALQGTSDLTIVFVGVAVGIALAWSRGPGGPSLRSSPLLLVPDAVGLAAFAATGAFVGVAADVSPFGVVLLATLTGVGGGSLADLLLVRVPAVLREDFYATPAALGGVVFWAADATLSRPLPSVGCVAVVLALRLLALRYAWRLPTL